MASVTKEDVVSFVSNMTVLELSELVKEFEQKFGVSAQAPVAVAAEEIKKKLEAAGAKVEIK